MEKIALVTGSSSGIGLETSLALARNGFYTFATMRDLKKSEKIKEKIENENLTMEILELDVDDDQSVNTAVKTILEKKERIDVLVNNAGYGTKDHLFGLKKYGITKHHRKKFKPVHNILIRSTRETL